MGSIPGTVTHRSGLSLTSQIGNSRLNLRLAMWKWLQQIGLLGSGLPSLSGARQATPASQRSAEAPSPTHGPTNGHSEESGTVAGTGREFPTDERTNEQWVAAFRCHDLSAIVALRERLTTGLFAALRRAASKRRIPHRTEALAEDAVREATDEILDDPEVFWNEGTSEEGKEEASSERKFTTWAQKIAVHIAFTKLRREDGPLSVASDEKTPPFVKPRV